MVRGEGQHPTQNPTPNRPKPKPQAKPHKDSVPPARGPRVARVTRGARVALESEERFILSSSWRTSEHHAGPGSRL